jgi:hypothetical protein
MCFALGGVLGGGVTRVLHPAVTGCPVPSRGHGWSVHGELEGRGAWGADAAVTIQSALWLCSNKPEAGNGRPPSLALYLTPRHPPNTNPVLASVTFFAYG